MKELVTPTIEAKSESGLHSASSIGFGEKKQIKFTYHFIFLNKLCVKLFSDQSVEPMEHFRSLGGSRMQVGIFDMLQELHTFWGGHE